MDRDDVVSFLKAESLHTIISDKKLRQTIQNSRDEFFETFKELSNSVETNDRLAGIIGMVFLDNRSSFNLLVGLLEDNSKDVQKRAAWGLRNITNPQISNKLEDFSTHQDPWVRKNITMLLGRIGNDEAFKIIISMADDNDANVRVEVAKALSRYQHAQSIKTTEKLMLDSDVKVREEATGSLQNFEDGQTVDLLIKQLSDESVSVRFIVEELLRINKKLQFDTLRNELRNANELNKRHIVRLLGYVEDKRANEVLKDLLNNDVQPFTDDAATALARQGKDDAKVLGYLIDAYKSGKSDIGVVVGLRYFEIPPTQDSLEILAQALHDDDLRDESIKSIEQIRYVDAQLISKLISATNYEEAFATDAVKRIILNARDMAIKPLLDTVETGNDDEVWFAIDMLNNIGDYRAIPHLIALQKRTNNPKLRGLAESVLNTLTNN